MASEIRLPVRLEVMLGSLLNILQVLNTLKPDTRAYKELASIFTNMGKEMDKLQIASSKPFIDEKQFTEVEKSLSKIEGGLDKTRLITSRINFSDLKLTPELTAIFAEFLKRIEESRLAVTKFKDELKTNLFADVNTASFLDQIDPTLINKSFDEIVKAIDKKTKEVNAAFLKSKTEREKLMQQQSAGEKVDKTLKKDNILDPSVLSRFNDFFKMGDSGKLLFQKGKRNEFIEYLKELYTLSDADVEQLRKLNAELIKKVLNSLEGRDSVFGRVSKTGLKAAAKLPEVDTQYKNQGAQREKLIAINLNLAASLERLSGVLRLAEKDLAAINAEARNAQNAAEGAARGNTAYANACNSLVGALGNTRNALSSTHAEFSKMLRTMNNISAIKMATANFLGFHQVLNTVKRGIKNALNTIKEVDTIITRISIVTNKTGSDLWGEVGNYSNLALKYGATTKGAYEVSLIYYQLGLKLNEVLTLTNETLKLAKISGLDYAATTDYMTSALRGFKMEMSEASVVVDVYSNLAAHAAVTLEELAVAMSKTASSMESVGSTFLETSAMIATMVTVTRESATNIGSALKSIAARYGEMKKDPLSLMDSEGEELSYNKVDAALKSVGISLKDTNGQFRDFTDVIVELSEVWDKLDSTLQRYIATLFAGNRQQSRFLALVGNLRLLKSNLQYAEDSEGTGDLQVEKSLDGIESRINKLKASYEKFYMSLGVQDAWKALITGATDYLNVLTSVDKKFSNLISGALGGGDAAKTIGSIFSKIPVVSMIADIISLIRSALDRVVAHIASIWLNTVLAAGEAGTRAGLAYAQNLQRTAGQGTLQAVNSKWNEPAAGGLKGMGQYVGGWVSGMKDNIKGIPQHIKNIPGRIWHGKQGLETTIEEAQHRANMTAAASMTPEIKTAPPTTTPPTIQPASVTTPPAASDVSNAAAAANDLANASAQAANNMKEVGTSAKEVTQTIELSAGTVNNLNPSNTNVPPAPQITGEELTNKLEESGASARILGQMAMAGINGIGMDEATIQEKLTGILANVLETTGQIKPLFALAGTEAIQEYISNMVTAVNGGDMAMQISPELAAALQLAVANMPDVPTLLTPEMLTGNLNASGIQEKILAEFSTIDLTASGEELTSLVVAIFEKMASTNMGETLRTAFANASNDAIGGYVEGLLSGIGATESTAAQVGTASVESLRNAIGAHSNATAFIPPGAEADGGFVEGMESGVDGVREAGRKIGEASVLGAKEGVEAGKGSIPLPSEVFAGSLNEKGLTAEQLAGFDARREENNATLRASIGDIGRKYNNPVGYADLGELIAAIDTEIELVRKDAQAKLEALVEPLRAAHKQQNADLAAEYGPKLSAASTEVTNAEAEKAALTQERRDAVAGLKYDRHGNIKSGQDRLDDVDRRIGENALRITNAKESLKAINSEYADARTSLQERLNREIRKVLNDSPEAIAIGAEREDKEVEIEKKRNTLLNLQREYNDARLLATNTGRLIKLDEVAAINGNQDQLRAMRLEEARLVPALPAALPAALPTDETPVVIPATVAPEEGTHQQLEEKVNEDGPIKVETEIVPSGESEAEPESAEPLPTEEPAEDIGETLEAEPNEPREITETLTVETDEAKGAVNAFNADVESNAPTENIDIPNDKLNDAADAMHNVAKAASDVPGVIKQQATAEEDVASSAEKAALAEEKKTEQVRKTTEALEDQLAVLGSQDQSAPEDGAEGGELPEGGNVNINLTGAEEAAAALEVLKSSLSEIASESEAAAAALALINGAANPEELAAGILAGTLALLEHEEGVRRTGDAYVETLTRALAFAATSRKLLNLGTVVRTLGTMIGTVAKQFGMSSKSARKLAGVVTIVGGVISAIGALGTTIKAVDAASKAAAASNPWMAIAMAVMAVASGIAMLVLSEEEELEDLNEVADKARLAAEEAKQEYKTLDSNYKKLEELKLLRYENTEAAEEYLSAVDEIVEQFPELIASYDEAGNAVVRLTEVELALTAARIKSAQKTIEQAKAETDVLLQTREALKEAAKQLTGGIPGTVTAGSGLIAQAINNSLNVEWQEALGHSYTYDQNAISTILTKALQAAAAGDYVTAYKYLSIYDQLADLFAGNPNTDVNFTLINSDIGELRSNILLGYQTLRQIDNYADTAGNAWLILLGYDFATESSGLARLVGLSFLSTYRKLYANKLTSASSVAEWLLWGSNGSAAEAGLWAEDFWRALNPTERELFNKMLADPDHYSWEDLNEKFNKSGKFDKLFKLLKQAKESESMSYKRSLSNLIADANFTALDSKLATALMDRATQKNTRTLNGGEYDFVTGLISLLNQSAVYGTGRNSQFAAFDREATKLYDLLYDSNTSADERNLIIQTFEKNGYTYSGLKQTQALLALLDISDSLRSSLDDIVSGLIESSFISYNTAIQAAADLFETNWEKEASTLTKMSKGMTIKEAEAWVELAKYYGSILEANGKENIFKDITLSDLQESGGKFTASVEQIKAYLDGYLLSYLDELYDYQEKLDDILAKASGDYYLKTRNESELIQVASELGILDEFFEKDAATNTYKFKAGKRAADVVEALRSANGALSLAIQSNQDAIDLAYYYAQEAADVLLKAGIYDSLGLGIDREESLTKLKKFASKDVIYKGSNLAVETTVKGILSSYGSFLSDLLSKGYENIDWDKYDYLLKEDLDLGNVSYVTYVLTYAKYANKTISEINELMVKAIEKDNLTTDADVLKNLNFINLNLFTVTLSLLKDFANRFLLSMDLLIADGIARYDEVINGYVVDWRRILGINLLQADEFYTTAARSLMENDSTYASVTSTLARIQELSNLINSTDSQVSDARKKEYIEELKLAKEILRIRSTEEDSSFKFMSNKIPGAQNNPINYAENWYTAFSKLDEGIKSGYMDYLDFYNMFNELANLAETSENGVVIAGETYTNGQKVRELIEKAALALSIDPTDGKAKVDMSKLATFGLDFSLGTEAMRASVAEGIQNLAHGEVEMLDAMILLLEVVVKMEALGDITTEDHHIDLTQLFTIDGLDDDGNPIYKFNTNPDVEGGTTVSKWLEQFKNLGEAEQDLSTGLANISWGGKSFHEWLDEAETNGISELDMNILGAIIDGFWLMVESGEWDLQKLYDSLSDQLLYLTEPIELFVQEGVKLRLSSGGIVKVTTDTEGNDHYYDDETNQEYDDLLTLYKARAASRAQKWKEELAAGQEIIIDENVGMTISIDGMPYTLVFSGEEGLFKDLEGNTYTSIDKWLFALFEDSVGPDGDTSSVAFNKWKILQLLSIVPEISLDTDESLTSSLIEALKRDGIDTGEKLADAWKEAVENGTTLDFLAKYGFSLATSDIDNPDFLAKLNEFMEIETINTNLLLDDGYGGQILGFLTGTQAVINATLNIADTFMYGGSPLTKVPVPVEPTGDGVLKECDVTVDDENLVVNAGNGVSITLKKKDLKELGLNVDLGAISATIDTSTGAITLTDSSGKSFTLNENAGVTVTTTLTTTDGTGNKIVFTFSGTTGLGATLVTVEGLNGQTFLTTIPTDVTTFAALMWKLTLTGSGVDGALTASDILAALNVVNSYVSDLITTITKTAKIVWVDEDGKPFAASYPDGTFEVEGEGGNSNPGENGENPGGDGSNSDENNQNSNQDNSDNKTDTKQADKTHADDSANTVEPETKIQADNVTIETDNKSTESEDESGFTYGKYDTDRYYSVIADPNSTKMSPVTFGSKELGRLKDISTEDHFYELGAELEKVMPLMYLIPGWVYETEDYIAAIKDGEVYISNKPTQKREESQNTELNDQEETETPAITSNDADIEAKDTDVKTDDTGVETNNANVDSGETTVNANEVVIADADKSGNSGTAAGTIPETTIPVEVYDDTTSSKNFGGALRNKRNTYSLYTTTYEDEDEEEEEGEKHEENRTPEDTTKQTETPEDTLITGVEVKTEVPKLDNPTTGSKSTEYTVGTDVHGRPIIQLNADSILSSAPENGKTALGLTGNYYTGSEDIWGGSLTGNPDATNLHVIMTPDGEIQIIVGDLHENLDGSYWYLTGLKDPTDGHFLSYNLPEGSQVLYTARSQEVGFYNHDGEGDWLRQHYEITDQASYIAAFDLLSTIANLMLENPLMTLDDSSMDYIGQIVTNLAIGRYKVEDGKLVLAVPTLNEDTYIPDSWYSDDENNDTWTGTYFDPFMNPAVKELGQLATWIYLESATRSGIPYDASLNPTKPWTEAETVKNRGLMGEDTEDLYELNSGHNEEEQQVRLDALHGFGIGGYKISQESDIQYGKESGIGTFGNSWTNGVNSTPYIANGLFTIPQKEIDYYDSPLAGRNMQLRDIYEIMMSRTSPGIGEKPYIAYPWNNDHYYIENQDEFNAALQEAKTLLEDMEADNSIILDDETWQLYDQVSQILSASTGRWHLTQNGWEFYNPLESGEGIDPWANSDILEFNRIVGLILQYDSDRREAKSNGLVPSESGEYVKGNPQVLGENSADIPDVVKGYNGLGSIGFVGLPVQTNGDEWNYEDWIKAGYQEVEGSSPNVPINGEGHEDYEFYDWSLVGLSAALKDNGWELYHYVPEEENDTDRTALIDYTSAMLSVLQNNPLAVLDPQLESYLRTIADDVEKLTGQATQNDNGEYEFLSVVDENHDLREGANWDWNPDETLKEISLIVRLVLDLNEKNKNYKEGGNKSEIETEAQVSAKVDKGQVNQEFAEEGPYPVKVNVTSVTGLSNLTIPVKGVTGAKGNVALAGGTLMGELGPELVVSNGRYFVVGQNGPEMINLPKDAIVFNHLQTNSLLKRGSASSYGKPVTSEKNAVALAKGNSDTSTLLSDSSRQLSTANDALGKLALTATSVSDTNIANTTKSLSVESGSLLHNFNRVNYEANQAKWHIRTLGEYSGQAEHPVHDLGVEADIAKDHVSKMGELAGGSEDGIVALGEAASTAAGQLSQIKAPSLGGLFTGLFGGISGNANAKGTLMGELGPELVVSGGRYFVVGLNGPEMVDLADDAIVFNHLLTQSLLGKGSTIGRGKAVTNEQTAVAFAKGSIHGGPAKASAQEALNTLRQLRAEWKALESISAKDLASKGGGGGGGGGGDAFIKALERWYNLLQEIAQLEQKITYELAKRQKIQSDIVKDGLEYYLSLKRSLHDLEQEVLALRQLAEEQEAYFKERRELMNSALNPFTALYTFDENGQLKYKNGAFELLSELSSSNELTGAPNHTIEEQYNLLIAWGYGDYMKYDNSGKEIEAKDEAGKKSAVDAFWAKIEADKSEMQELHDSIEEHKKAVLEKQQAENEILKEIEDNLISLEGRVLEAIENTALREIDKLLDQKEAIEASNLKLIDGLTTALEKELKLYLNEQNLDELVSLLRQLAILRRSGGSASEIKSKLDEIDIKSRDIYFNKQKDQIDALLKASEALIDKLQEQIDIATETLEYQKENGLLWERVYDEMAKSPEEIATFIQLNTTEYWGKSPTDLGLTMRDVLFEAEWWKAYAQDNTDIKTLLETIVDTVTEERKKAAEEDEKEAGTTLGEVGSGNQNKDNGSSKWTVRWDEKSKRYVAMQSAGGKYNNYSEARVARDLMNALSGSKMALEGGSEEKSGRYEGFGSEGKVKADPGKIAGTTSYFIGLYNSKEKKYKKTRTFTDLAAAQSAYSALQTEPGWVKVKQGFSSGGMDYETGLAMLHGTASKPEAVLNASQTAILRNNILGSNRNSLLNLLMDFRDAYTGLSDSTYSSINAPAGTIIENATVQMNVEQIANDYDALRAGEQALQKMLDIARKTSANNSVRR